ncbi:hypothetical protein D0Y60_16490 [Shinella sp. WSJ-2]|uniref:hypothetical protein n=1 Tax=Shinella sp. WSJ-2 TaxID=2303749 RepID=UPI000E3C68E4|nr:hypothetical protein [Shinella sp. WSJ-2]RFZ86579.1 hypothetical protein D0Y60_16490 [Shinella sp. WSJ-2]
MSIFESCKLYLRARPFPAIAAIGLGIANSMLSESSGVAPSVQFLLSMASLAALLFVGYTALVDMYRYLAPKGRKPIDGSSTIWSYVLRTLAIGLCWTVPYFALFTVVSRLELPPTLNLIVLQIPSVVLGSLVWSIFGVWLVSAIADGSDRQLIFQRTKGPIISTFGMFVAINSLLSAAFVLSNIATQHLIISAGSAVIWATLGVFREIVVAPILINAYLRDRSNIVGRTPSSDPGV